MYQHLDDNDLLAEIDVITRERDTLDRIARAGRYDSQDAARQARNVGQKLVGLHIERQQRGLDIDSAA
ncbi:hypothetical protein [Rhodococcoides kyotonense]|uniref:Uncharacterized protein n=1 Tax=Rhodococcoides kyotonense TaxID=398843 RepID=A0A239FQW9_9NOCA|nr:hypothetical protein [Rhodococcus kyotonensis]SNS59291.1 hypothetical protein SAMN05421642_103416 [Rhodococcus kyotonensis]